jgi:hypothetical protein
LEDLA